MAMATALAILVGGLAYIVSPTVRTLTARTITSYQQGQLQERFAAVWQRWSLALKEKLYSPSDDSAYWQVESRAERQALPLYRSIPAEDPARLTQAAAWPHPEAYLQWHRSNGDSSSSRYSALAAINRENVDGLDVAWTYRPGTGDRNIQSNPVIAGGLLFTPTGGHDIVALNAQTGAEVWKFDPGVEFPAKRGLIWWSGKAEFAPRIYFPAGSSLRALDAATGKPVNSFGDDGAAYCGAPGKIAPAIVGDILVHATLEPAIQGYDVITGERLWSLPLRDPNPPLRAAGLPSRFEGGRPWGGMAVDEGRAIAYIATSNPSPPLVGVDRPGDNVSSISVMAIDVRKGSVIWTFQEIAHDLWDLDLPASPILTSIMRDNRKVDVVAAVTKYGNTLLLDRLTGKPIFDYRLRRAPTSSVPGEKTAPYQPDLELPEPFARQVFSMDDVTDIGPKNRQAVLDQLGDSNFGFFMPHEPGVQTVFYGLHGGAEWPGASVDPERGLLYVAGNNVPSMATIIELTPTISETGMPETAGRKSYLKYCAQCHGQSREGDAGPSLQWLGLRTSQSAVVDVLANGQQAMPPVEDITGQETKDLLAYLFSRDRELRDSDIAAGSARTNRYERTEYRKLRDHEGYPGVRPPWGTLSAIDLNTGRVAWQVPLGEHPELTERGISRTGTENFGGPLVTAGGLVFVSGTKDRRIRAFDSATGEELWSHELPFVGSAPPATYTIDGRQYLVVPATGGGTLRLYDERVEVGDAFLAFALP
jgi:quinoprotein glucose dehydrogenase